MADPPFRMMNSQRTASTTKCITGFRCWTGLQGRRCRGCSQANRQIRQRNSHREAAKNAYDQAIEMLAVRNRLNPPSPDAAQNLNTCPVVAAAPQRGDSSSCGGVGVACVVEKL